MGSSRRPLNYVVGPCGEPMTLESLPPSGTKRWVARHKAEIVAAVNGGLLSLEEARERYALSAEEFLSWQDAMVRFGLAGLHATRMQENRTVSSA